MIGTNLKEDNKFEFSTFKLKADNSSQNLEMTVAYQEDEFDYFPDNDPEELTPFFFSLDGKNEGKDFQIDFNGMTIKQFKDLNIMILLMIEMFEGDVKRRI